MVSWIQGTRSAAAVPLAACAELLPPDARADDPLLQLQRTSSMLREHAAGRPIAIGVDDAQRLDPASAALILQLTLNGTAFVLATIRSGEPCPDAVQSLWKDAGGERIELRPLSEPQTGELIEAVLGGPVEQRARRWLFDSSQGNVLYIHELVRTAVDAGAFVNVDGYWRLTRRPSPSASLTELIGGRLSELNADQRHVIELLALGEPLRLAELVSLAGAEEPHRSKARDGGGRGGGWGGDDPACSSALRGCCSARLCRCSGRPRCGATWPGSWGSESGDRSRDDALLIARWLLDAGDPVPKELMMQATAAAIADGDPELGERLGRLALEAGGGGWRSRAFGGSSVCPTPALPHSGRGGPGPSGRQASRRRRPRSPTCSSASSACSGGCAEPRTAWPW